MKDQELRDKFHAYRPPIDDNEVFMDELMVQMDAVDEKLQHASIVPLYRRVLPWIASAAAAVIIVFFLLTNKQVEDVPSRPQVASVAQKETVKPQQQESVTESTPIAGEPEQTIMERPTIKQSRRKTHRNVATITERQVNNMMAAANFTNEQVETYRLQPVGDATIVTKTRVDGTSASYIVCLSDDNEGLHVVPINIEM